MKKNVVTGITIITTLSLSVLGFILGGIKLSELQFDTLLVLAAICLFSVLFCFLIGEITMNNSQVDKLWSILPIIYVWVIAIKGNMEPRLIIMAVLITIWGVRLTYNFAKKGAYQIRFWKGEEDYRWVVLRNNPNLNKRWKWGLFNFFFISLYQNALILAITFPLVAVMESNRSLNGFDFLIAAILFMFILIETIADRQQMAFQNQKYELLKKEKDLTKLPSPYNIGFNTQGLWSRSRHPNYFSEQSIWVVLYLFTISAGMTTYYLFNWSLIGSMLLILLFIGSSKFSEGITRNKYPLYDDYINKVSKYVPLKKYKS